MGGLSLAEQHLDASAASVDKTAMQPAASPTPYPELNMVLAALLDGVRQALGENLVGLYLQGSFAVGDFTPWSDCDFIVVTREDLSPDQLAALQRMHPGIHELPAPYWRNGLEGSYAPAAILRRWSIEPRDPPGEPRANDWADPGLSGSPAQAYPFWYLDHGSKTLARSEHDNTQVVRWCLRELGVVLHGPDPKDLIDPVTPEMLRAEVRGTMDKALATGLPMPMVAWQAFYVGLYCRILHTIAAGEVTSKKKAMAWAQEALDPRWRGLITRAAALKKGDDKTAALPADPTDAAATQEFARYCIAFADKVS